MHLQNANRKEEKLLNKRMLQKIQLDKLRVCIVGGTYGAVMVTIGCPRPRTRSSLDEAVL